MTEQLQADIKPGRLSKAEIEANFSDMHPPLERPEALIEADRCYFCFDAPCTTACPTGIDIPGFIQKIRSNNVKGSAHTILSENIMGGMCSRVCPTEVLCEEVCVRNTLEDQPVRIGLLQRYATDSLFQSKLQLFQRREDTGKRIAVVGGGPASLSCAHRLASLGHQVTVLNGAEKPGGLNEYGIAAYKTVNDFAQAEVDYILDIGGIDIRNGKSLGTDFSLAEVVSIFVTASPWARIFLLRTCVVNMMRCSWVLVWPASMNWEWNMTRAGTRPKASLMRLSTLPVCARPRTSQNCRWAVRCWSLAVV
jgi:glutamate synthase (NADPH/NADH) small chain